MKKSISILILGVMPTIALTAGNHPMHGEHNIKQDPHQHAGHNHAIQAAAGRPGDSAHVNRTVDVAMHDIMRFEPANLMFKAGETVRFVVRNVGKIRHELVIGTVAELKEHADMMRKMPDMQHEDPNMITLAPGEQGELFWQFDNAGVFDFACLIPGHLEAGMSGKIAVE